MHQIVYRISDEDLHIFVTPNDETEEAKLRDSS